MTTETGEHTHQQASVAAPVRDGFSARWSVAILLVLVFCPLWHLHIFNRRLSPSYSDLVQRWVGTRAALAGKNPYSAEVLRDILTAEYGHYPPRADDEGVARQGFLYPAHMVLLLAPIAHLSWQAARAIFLVTSLTLLLIGIWLYLRTFHVDITRAGASIITLLAIVNWPVIWGARFQQPTLLIAAFILLAFVCLRRDWHIVAGILLAIATVKPQLTLPVIAWLIAGSLFQRAWRFIASFAIALSLLLFETERIVPGWFGNWRSSLHGYRQVTETDLPLQNFLGHWAGLILTLILVTAGALALWSSLRTDMASARWRVSFSLVLALTLVLNPTHFTMAYNQVLLFPACVTMIAASPSDPYSRFARQIAFVLLGVMFALPVISVAIETIWQPYKAIDGLPNLTNSLLPPAVALALLCQAVSERVGRKASAKPGQVASSSV